MLKIEDMHVYYGAIHAIKGVTFEVGEGEIVALIVADGEIQPHLIFITALGQNFQQGQQF